ncbi:hypothetical protein RDI58_008441 [Solanum bulbocastanum]|uniref:DUF4283 domain-containing protein n=1 Tax=Solanum bulbocastanum TaxID=147425 RepID=A0AAN8TUY0_SOLBU
MELYIANAWRFAQKPQTLAHDDGYFIFRFDSKEVCDKVLMGGPYTYRNKPFMIQAWKRDFEFNPDCITTIPLWVTFPSLPVGFWSNDSFE